ncbi:NAD(P)H-dependent glycerol-3-phosphate dehydrogenase [Pajaroellobacter abortibovis]|uniref:Glycerol-3-phosphate dehydrogenase [NAD(P)+] n=1 Tax=Pajaroellobacter abortibovis TaxID=1882918 RepID=A0A1L6MUX2_9BACT|nr:NAD(P)H-dependent glycerol-3-phosphate dehydrogenase [Pajaroellobacter abortibovis]APR99286.1 glycerol-3-phosphate dehydrogenase [Pajaroellobacter abortibovis]
MNKVAIFGSGAWGTALAIHATRRGHAVNIWSFEQEIADEISSDHRNTAYLPGVQLPAVIQASVDVEKVSADADIVILAPPSRYFRSVANLLRKNLAKHAIVAIASKGIEVTSHQFLFQILEEALPEVSSERYVCLSGPTFAREVAKGLPTDIVAASKGAEAAQRAQGILHAPTFRVYRSEDPMGVGIGGAIKNVIAIATGACDGLGLGNNARAALITRGLAEMVRLGVALGANALTFLGLAGMGDLVLTCTGALSRNRTLGMKVAEGIDAKQFLASQKTVAEGFFSAHAAYKLSQKYGVEMPITEQVYQVLYQGRPLKAAMHRLMERSFKEELAGIE